MYTKLPGSNGDPSTRRLCASARFTASLAFVSKKALLAARRRAWSRANFVPGVVAS